MQTDSPKSTTLYSQFAPCRQLAPYVACYWTVTGNDRHPATRIRVLPDGCMDAIFDFTQDISVSNVPQIAGASPAAFIVGVSEVPAVVPLPRSPRTLGIRFKPGGAAPLLNIPASEFAESRVDLDGVMPGFAQLMFSLAGEAESPQEMTAIAERLLLERLGTPQDTNGFATHAIGSMWHNRSSLRVSALADTMGVTNKTLERNIRYHTGLTPKRLGRTMRFVSAVRSLHAAPDRSLSQVALDLGYTDQAHFTREFKRMSGLPPKKWLKERSDVDFLQYTPVRLG